MVSANAVAEPAAAAAGGTDARANTYVDPSRLTRYDRSTAPDGSIAYFPITTAAAAARDNLVNNL